MLCLIEALSNNLSVLIPEAGTNKVLKRMVKVMHGCFPDTVRFPRTGMLLDFKAAFEWLRL